MSKQVAVILVNWNGFDHTSACIESLRSMPFTDYDIILVDNASADGSGRLLAEKFAGIIFIESASNLGFSGGNNLGMQYAIEHGYPYQLLLNNDTIVDNNFLEPLVRYMNEHPGTGAIQPMIFFEHNTSLIWNAGSYFNKWLGYASSVNYNKPILEKNKRLRETGWITGCAFLTRSAVLKQTGLFAGNLFMYYEDIDLSFRIAGLGYRLIFYPGSVIYHKAGMSGKSKIKTKEGYVDPLIHYYNIRNRIWILKKYTSVLHSVTVILYNTCYISAVLLFFLVRGRFGKLKISFKALLDGLSGKMNYQPVSLFK